ncbi:hypothetical protein PG984_010358 [Apiospora sp. TS-2023a]
MPSTTPPPHADLRGTILLPVMLTVGPRTEQGTHYDKYQVGISSDFVGCMLDLVLRDYEIVPFLVACVFYLNGVPQKVRKHRLRCMRRLESRKVFELRRDGYHVLVIKVDNNYDNKNNIDDVFEDSGYEGLRKAILDYIG